MRPGEENGDQYWFISKEEFEIAIEQNDFLEYEINHKVAYYGTKKSEVDA
jgi:guanylate kinase